MSFGAPALCQSARTRYFLRSLRWAAAILVLWGGCAGDRDSSESRPFQSGLQPEFIHGQTAISCGAAKDWRPLEGINPAEVWDYMSLRRLGTSGGSVEVLQELGELCAGAKAREACLAEVDASFATSLTPAGVFLLGTQGDEVRTFRGPQALTLFGELDTADEAMFLALGQAQTVKPCDPRTSVKHPADGSFVIDTYVAQAGDACEFSTSHADRIFSYVVRSDGSVSQTTASAPFPNGCGVPRRLPLAAGRVGPVTQ
jgi:hypothetical protein